MMDEKINAIRLELLVHKWMMDAKLPLNKVQSAAQP
jgi:hypothetical protein